jgi:hypothetical protein
MNIELEKCSGTEISLTQCLFLRTLFEELTRNYNMPEGSDIDTIKWFIKNGNKSNSLRNEYKRALNIAKIIKEFSDGCTKKTRTRKQVRVF